MRMSLGLSFSPRISFLLSQQPLKGEALEGACFDESPCLNHSLIFSFCLFSYGMLEYNQYPGRRPC